MTIARAVLLVGSAKPAGTSTSEVLGRYLCARLAERGVATTVLFVGRSPASHADRQLLAALADANLFVLATPVYVDSLPYLVTRTLEYVSQSAPKWRAPCAFAALTNCGFPQPETRKNFVNSFWINCDANYARTFFVAQRDVSWIGWEFTGYLNFVRGRSTGNLVHQFGCALRCSQNHFRINAALESIACVALQI